MKEIEISIYQDAGGFLAGVERSDGTKRYFDRRGLEGRIFRGRARREDTEHMEEQHRLLVRLEAWRRDSARPSLALNHEETGR